MGGDLKFTVQAENRNPQAVPNTSSQKSNLVDFDRLGEDQSTEMAVRAGLARASAQLIERELENPLLNAAAASSSEGVHLDSAALPSLIDDLLTGKKVKIEGSQDRWITLEHQAQLYQQERGVHSLFIGIGAASWSDAKSGKSFSAPLLLLPIEIRRDPETRELSISGPDSQWQVNPALARVLKTRYRLELPTLKHQTLALDLEALKGAMESSPLQCRVEPSHAVAAVFSFSNQVILDDLDPDNWPEHAKPWLNPFVAALFAQGFAAKSSFIRPHENVDERRGPLECLDVLNADSSQIRVIDDAVRGQSLVVEGPPGTGKTTTLANLLVNAASAGKRVLVIAEKKAALQVVRKWLTNCGLGDLALDLYADSAKSAAVLEEVRRTRNLGKPIQIAREVTVDRLELALIRLNNHAKALTSEIRSSGVTGYEALSQFIAYRSRDQDLLDLDSPEMRQWTAKDYAAAERLCDSLQRYYSSNGMPSSHPFFGCHLTSSDLRDIEPLKGALKHVAESGTAARSAVHAVLGELGLNTQATASELKSSIQLLRFISDFYTEDGALFSQVELSSPVFRSSKESVANVINTGRQFFRMRSELGKMVKPDAWRVPNLDRLKKLLDYEVRLHSRGEPASENLPILESAIRELCLPGKMPEETADKAKLVDRLIEFQKLKIVAERGAPEWKKTFGERWTPGPNRDQTFWNQLEFVVGFLNLFTERASAHPEFDKFCALIKSPKRLYALVDSGKLDQAEQAIDDFLAARQELRERMRFDPELFDKKLSHQSIADQETTINGWAANLDRLKELAGYVELLNSVEFPGKEELVRKAQSWEASGTKLKEALRSCWFSGLAEDFLNYSPASGEFKDALHEKYIEEFREADRKLLSQNAAAVALRHWGGIPRIDTGGQNGVLCDELKKDRDLLPLRELLGKAGQALQATKPIFLMTPQTAAQFLPRGAIDFDLVVFDEGSQIMPIRALSPLMRSSQVVVFGDSKQLAPSTTFEDRAPVAEQAPENILQLLNRAGVSKRTLNWHHRSLREGMIKVANTEFYGGLLATMPDCERGKAATGLTFTKVNQTELSKQAITTLLAHIDTAPDESIGMIVGTEAEALELTLAVEKLAGSNERLKRYLAAHTTEPFFVKTVQNAQGDERDKIVILVNSQGPAGHGDSLSFLSLPQPERALNVLMTRARRSTDILSVIAPQDLDIGSPTIEARRILKSYLQYAASGALEQPAQASTGVENPFQSAVKAALEAKGYQVESNVGLSNIKLDLAVVDPRDSSRFLMGIMMDGPVYQQLDSARERERLVPEALEKRGWNLHRMWIIDWIKSPEAQTEKLLKHLTELRQQLPPALFESADRPIKHEVKRESRFASAAEGIVTPYTRAQINIEGASGQQPSIEDLRTIIGAVVSIESPIHRDEAFNRVRMAFGINTAAPELIQAFEAAETDALRASQIKKQGEFLYAPDGAPIAIRDRSALDGTLRLIGRISPEEIEAATILAAKNACGIEAAQLTSSTLQLLGIEVEHPENRLQVDGTVARLIKNGILRQHNGQLVLVVDRVVVRYGLTAEASRSIIS